MLFRALTVGTAALVLALPATVAVRSGWVGIGRMTGFGQVYPLPGIFNSLHLDTAVTLPVGVEAYAAYALRAWLSASAVVSARTRRFASRSAIGSPLLPASAVPAPGLCAAPAAHGDASTWSASSSSPPGPSPAWPLVVGDRAARTCRPQCRRMRPEVQRLRVILTR